MQSYVNYFELHENLSNNYELKLFNKKNGAVKQDDKKIILSILLIWQILYSSKIYRLENNKNKLIIITCPIYAFPTKK